MGCGLSASGFLIGSVVDPSMVPGGVSGFWRFALPVAGLLGLGIYLVLCFSDYSITMRLDGIESQTRTIASVRTTRISGLKELRIDQNGSAHLGNIRMHSTKVSWSRPTPRVVDSRRSLPLPAAVFNFPGAPSISEVEEITGVRIVLCSTFRECVDQRM